MACKETNTSNVYERRENSLENFSSCTIICSVFLCLTNVMFLAFDVPFLQVPSPYSLDPFLFFIQRE